MTYKFGVWLSAFICILSLVRSTFAQSPICSLETILSSFQSAALSDDTDVWAENYEGSDCPDNVKRSVRTLRRDIMITSTRTSPKAFISFGVMATGYGLTILSNTPMLPL
jgi:hypothetical protein